MAWIQTSWPILGATCLVLALAHGVVWANRGRPAHLALAVMLVSVLAISIQESLRLYDAPSVRAFPYALAQLPGTVLFLSVAYLVHREYPPGRRGLFGAIVAVRLAALAATALAGHIAFAPTDAARPLPLWDGPPGGVAGALSLLGMVLSIAQLADTLRRSLTWDDAPLAAQAKRVCGALLVLVLVAEPWRLAVLSGLVNGPDLLLPLFVAIALYISYVLGGTVFQSEQLSDDLRRTRSRLRESQVQMDEALRAARLSLWNWDFERRRFWASGFGEGLLDGAAATEVDELFGGDIHPDDAATVGMAVDMAVASGTLYCEYRLRPVSGLLTQWVVARGKVERAPNGEPVRMYGVLADVSERRQGEERFQLAVEAAPAAMLLVDGRGRITLVNHKAEEIFGYERAELLGMGVEDLVPVEFAADHQRDRQVYWAAPTARMMGVGRDLHALRKDGSLLPVEVAVTPIRHGADTLILASVTDLSQRKQLEHEAAVQRDELAHLSRVALLSELSGSLAHELNQPLTAILSNAQAALRFMAQTPPNLDEVQEVLGLIVDSDKRAGEVIRRMGAMLRKQPPDHQLLDVNDVVRDVLRIIRSDLLHRNTRTVLDLEEGLPTVLGDRVQLQQVLMNLLMNACDAMAGVRVDRRQLTVSSRMLSVRAIRLSVTDVGHGIPSADLERIFEPFVTTKTSGLGLGLAVCSTIIRSHQGRLVAENVPGSGACFSIELPTADA